MNNGNIVSLDGKYPLAALSRTVTNNIGDPIGDALRADCVAYYKFDGDFIDATGGGANLQKENAIGEPDFVPGIIGNAVHFANSGSPLPADAKFIGNGIGNPLGTAYPGGSNSPSPNLNLGTGYFYIFGWLQLNAGFSSFSQIFLRESVFTGANPVIEVDPSLGGSVDFGLSDFVTNLIPIDPNNWNFIECYFIPSNQGIYLAVNHGNFSGIDINNPSYVPENDIGPLYFGSGIDGDFPADVSMCHWGILKPASVPITQAERDYLWNDGAGRSLYP